jgi:hypothetical protein
MRIGENSMTPIEALYQRARTMQFEKQLSDGRSPFALAISDSQ